MKKKLSRLLCSVFLFLFVGSQLLSNVTFGSRQSAIKIASGAALNVSSPDNVFSVDGTLVIGDPLTSVAGNQIAFDDGVLEYNGSEAQITGKYDPDVDPEEVILDGDASFDAEPGTAIQKITVIGQNNRVEGQPFLSDIIEMTDSSTTLSIATQSTLNKDIDLQGGKLFLYDDLRLADDVRFLNGGTVNLQDRQLTLGGYYSSAWTGDITWESATDLALAGDLAIGGTWTFLDNDVIN